MRGHWRDLYPTVYAGWRGLTKAVSPLGEC